MLLRRFVIGVIFSNMNTNVSVVVITYNRDEELHDCLKSVYLNIDVLSEVVIVDNAASKKLEIALEKYRIQYPTVQLSYYPLNDNMGVSYARSFGFQHAKEDIIYFIDDDAYIKKIEEPFSAIVKRLLADPIAAAVANPICNYKSNIWMNPKLKSDDSYALSFIGASHILVKSRIVRQPLYPDELFYGHEDMWLSLEIYSQTKRIRWERGLIVWHSQAPNRQDYQKERYIAIGNKYAVKAVHFSNAKQKVLFLSLIKRCAKFWRFNIVKLFLNIIYALKMKKKIMPYSTRFSDKIENQFLDDFGFDFLRTGAESGKETRNM